MSARYFPASALTLTSDVPGAQLWAVALEQTMLTYFEVEPHSHFASHLHTSEQITYVLEGSLFFELEETVIEVKAGDVIAIPSNLPYAVYTTEQAVKAVDAWSPIMAKYRE